MAALHTFMCRRSSYETSREESRVHIITYICRYIVLAARPHRRLSLEIYSTFSPLPGTEMMSAAAGQGGAAGSKQYATNDVSY